MGAIAGTVGLPQESCAREAMLKTMLRRGGKQQDVLEFDHAVLLCTGDEKCGDPIMQLPGMREQYVIVCDGELYNADDLRKELIDLGHSFRGSTDTEVLLHAYMQWQEDMLLRLNGVFALAVYEVTRRKLFLARDRIGVKPLFYMRNAQGLIFASEIKTILAYPGVKANLDREGIGQILLLGPGRIPGSGVFQDVQELEPGCCACYQDGKLYTHRYWKLTDREHTETFEETSENIRTLVLDAIRRQTANTSVYGCFLSGGLDSSLISAVCAKQKAQRGEALDTFSVDYVDNDKFFQPGIFQPNSDPEYIRSMVEYMDSCHHWTVLSPEDLVRVIADTTCARDLPGMADVDASLNLFCGHIRAHVPVALSGECADEIFGGYPWYRDPVIRDYKGFPWAQTTGERKNFLLPWVLDGLDAEDFVWQQYQKTRKECDILPGTDPLNGRIKELVNLNFRWFMQTLLDRNDRMSAGHGLKVRVPLCDYRIAEYLYGVPWEMKDHGGREKGLLRYAMRSYLPEKVLYRKKSPYPKTHDPRYLELVSAMLRQVLQDKHAPIFQIVRKEALEGLLNTDFAWPWYGQLMRRPQTIVYMLQINFWLSKYSVRIV